MREHVEQPASTDGRLMGTTVKQSLWFAGLLVVAGCSSDSMTTPVPQGVAGTLAPAIAGTTGTTAGTAATPATAGVGAPVGVAGTGAAGTGATAGTPASPMAGTGAAGTAAAGSGAAGTGAAAAGSGGGSAAGASGAAGDDGAAGMAAPMGPADPSMMGPLEVMNEQVGEGFTYTIAADDRGDGVAGCASFAGSFGGDAQAANDFIKIPEGMMMDRYTLFRPATLEAGKKYPIVTWGNGTCAHPMNYQPMLTQLASHGFFVIAANSRSTGSGTVITRALDWAESVNMDSASPYYQQIDMEKVGAAGHSQGALGTLAASSDPRIKTVIFFNGVESTSKPFLTISGDRDLPFVSLTGMKSAVRSATKGAFLWYHMIPERGSSDGHLTLITEPMRVYAPQVAWFKYLLEDDPAAKEWLVGPMCKLCGRDAEFEYGASPGL